MKTKTERGEGEQQQNVSQKKKASPKQKTKYGQLTKGNKPGTIPVQAKYAQPIPAKHKPIQRKSLNSDGPYISSNTRKERARNAKSGKQEQKGRKDHGVVAVTQPKEYEQAIIYLKQSPTAAKIITFLEGLSVITKVQTSRAFHAGATTYDERRNTIYWYSRKGVEVVDINTRTEAKTKHNPKVLGYMSPAMGLFHEMVHAAIHHGYKVELEENVDFEKYHTAEHKFIVEMEHTVIDELKVADKNIQETKRNTYYGGGKEKVMKEDVVGTSEGVDSIKDIYSKKELLEKYDKYKARNKNYKKWEKAKKTGLVAITEPDEFKNATIYLRQSATASKVIDYLEGLKVMIKIQTIDGRFDLGAAGYKHGYNEITWYSHQGLAVTGIQTETEKDKNDNPEILGYRSPALSLFHEMLHAAIEHGYLEANNLKLEENVDYDKYHTAEHKFIVEQEHKVIDELKAVDKNSKETKRKTYYGGHKHLFMKDGETDAENATGSYFDVHTKEEYLKTKKTFKERKKEHKAIFGED